MASIFDFLSFSQGQYSLVQPANLFIQGQQRYPTKGVFTHCICLTIFGHARTVELQMSATSATSAISCPQKVVHQYPCSYVLRLDCGHSNIFNQNTISLVLGFTIMNIHTSKLPIALSSLALSFRVHSGRSKLFASFKANIWQRNK